MVFYGNIVCTGSIFCQRRLEFCLNSSTKALKGVLVCLYSNLNTQKPFSFHENPSSNETENGCTMKKSKSKNDITLICSTLDFTGKLVARSQPTSKSQLCSLHGLLPRDVRKLDGTLKNQLPAILVRPRAILVNVDYIKAIIKADTVILFESEESTERLLQSAFLLELKHKLQAIASGKKPHDAGRKLKALGHRYLTTSKSTSDGDVEVGMDQISLPFELTVLETILIQVCTSLQESLDQLVPEIDSSLYSLRDRFIHWNKLQVLLECKRNVNSFKYRVEGLRHSIEEVLNSDADMACMYLSEKASQGDVQREVEDHEEVELLLESYVKIIEEIAARVEELCKNMESTEDIVNIGLIGQRNELLLLELRLGIGTFAASLGSLGASIFGMNLHSGFELHPSAFYFTSGTLATIVILALLFTWRKLKALVRNH